MTVPPWLLPEDEPGKWIAAVQAAAVYALGLLLLTISVSFQSAAAPPSVEYISLIPTPQVEVAPPPEPEPEPELKPKPKPAEVKKPEAPKPDIALAEKKKREEQERKKREAEQKRERELKKKREEEARKKREEDERRKREQKAREEEKTREEKAKAERLAAANAEAKARYASILARRSAGYVDDIRNEIKSHHQQPLSVPKDPCIEVVITFKLKPYGKGGRADVVDIPVVVEPSGYPEYDESVLRAILKASPLTFPKEPELMEDFSEIRFEMTPEGVC